MEALKEKPLEYSKTAPLPEDETYGRSLQGHYSAGSTLQNYENLRDCPEMWQLREEFLTSLEEGLGTDQEFGYTLQVRKFYKLNTDNGHVLAHDDTRRIIDMTENATKCAVKTSESDKRFIPQKIRSIHDHNNALEVDKMVQGRTDYNTRIVVSPFPEEAALESGDDFWRNIGYVPSLRRGFVQLYHVNNDGEVLQASLSFDGANKEHLIRVFEKFGVNVPEGEITDNWLQYAVTGDYSEDKAVELAVLLAEESDNSVNTKTINTTEVTKKYEELIDKVFYETYAPICDSLVSGYKNDSVAETIIQYIQESDNFNNHYRGALYEMASREEFTSEDAKILHDLIVYSTIEMMRGLALDRASKLYNLGSMAVKQLLDVPQEQLSAMLSGFGGRGAKKGRVYSACGLEIMLGGEDDQDSPQEAFAGLGRGRNRDRLKNYNWKKGICRIKSCDSKGKPVDVGPCRICKNCEKKFDKGLDPTKDSIEVDQDDRKKTFQDIVAQMIQDAENHANNPDKKNKKATNR